MLAGCYASHQRGVGEDASSMGDVDASVRDASMPCRWQVVVPWRLESGAGDQALHDAAGLSTGFVVVTATTNDPPVEVQRFAHRVSLRAPLGAREEVFHTIASFHSTVGLGANDSGLLASMWDAGGCRIRSLDDMGHPHGEIRQLPLPTCAAPTGVGDTFMLIDRPSDEAPSIHTLSADTTRVIDTGPPIELLRRASWWSHARLDDGSYLVASMHEGVAPTRAHVQHMDARGTPLAPPNELPPFDAASRVRLTVTSAGVLAAWLEQPRGDVDARDRALRVVPLDADGNVNGPVLTPSRRVAYRDAGLSSAALDVGGAVFAFVEVAEGDDRGEHTSVVVVRTDGRGVWQEEARVASGRFQTRPVIRARGREVLVGYQAMGEGRTQVFVGGLECR